MVNATHAEAVAALKSVTTSCQLVVSREVLVVMPEDIPEEGEEGEGPVPPTTEDVQVTGEEEEETEVFAVEEKREGQEAAKKIVEEVLDRSLKR